MTGPGVDDFRSEPAADGSTRLTVRLDSADGKPPSARVTVRALTRVPAEGRWVIPGGRGPSSAVWTGGTTSVRVAPTRVIEAVRPLSGRRTASTPGEPTEDHRLDFAADRAAPVAELVFRKPRVDASAEVRGQLLVGATSPRLNGRMTWTFHHGRPLGLEIDLPRAWVADRVEVDGSDDPVSWHSEDFPDGGSRVHVVTPPGDWAGRSLVLNLGAISSVAGGRGPLALPRLRPVGARVADEVWVARVDIGPDAPADDRARGLAWIDPATPPPAPRRPRRAEAWPRDRLAVDGRRRRGAGRARAVRPDPARVGRPGRHGRPRPPGPRRPRRRRLARRARAVDRPGPHRARRRPRRLAVLRRDDRRRTPARPPPRPGPPRGRRPRTGSVVAGRPPPPPARPGRADGPLRGPLGRPRPHPAGRLARPAQGAGDLPRARRPGRPHVGRHGRGPGARPGGDRRVARGRGGRARVGDPRATAALTRSSTTRRPPGSNSGPTPCRPPPPSE